VAHDARGRSPDRAPGDDRMTSLDATIETALAGLTVPAPATLRPAVLVETGLADWFGRVDSPIGPIVVAWNGLGVSLVDAERDDVAFEARHPATTGRPAFPAP